MLFLSSAQAFRDATQQILFKPSCGPAQHAVKQPPAVVLSMHSVYAYCQASSVKLPVYDSMLLYYST